LEPPSLPYAPFFTIGVLLILGIWIIPFAEELAIIVASYCYATGQASLLALLSVTILGVFVGDSLGFWAGRCGSRLWLRRVVAVGKEHPWCQHLGTLLDRHGVVVLLGARFLPGVRLPAHFVVGTRLMSYGTYAAVRLVAVLIYVPLFFAVAYACGEEVAVAQRALQRLSSITWWLCLLVTLLWLVLRYGPLRLSLRGIRQLLHED
jgi:membrane protein DedA with SNARE-associated domain